jgi:hypothetical protein
MEKLIKENENLEKIITDQGEKIIELKNYIETLKEVICQQGIIIENFRNYKKELNQGKIEQRKLEVRKLKETEKGIRNGMDIEKNTGTDANRKCQNRITGESNGKYKNRE